MPKRWVLPSYDGIDALAFEDAEVPAPDAGEVSIHVTAAGVNPSDYKGLSGGWNADSSLLPLEVGQEIAGVVTAVGSGATIATGPVAVGDRVVAFKIAGGFATDVTVAAKDVFSIPAGLDDRAAAGLLHVGVVAAELLHLSRATAGDAVLVHGGAGSVGSLVIQLAHRAGAHTIATGSPASQARIRALGAEPVIYGEGLAERVRELAPGGLDAAIDAVGTEEALTVSLELVPDRDRIATLAPGPRAREAGVKLSAGASPASIAFREPQRATILALAASGAITLPIVAAYALADAPAALRFVASGHPAGKVVLVP